MAKHNHDDYDATQECHPDTSTGYDRKYKGGLSATDWDYTESEMCNFCCCCGSGSGSGGSGGSGDTSSGSGSGGGGTSFSRVVLRAGSGFGIKPGQKFSPFSAPSILPDLGEVEAARATEAIGTISKLIEFGSSLKNIVQLVTEKHASKETYETRKTICENCQEVDQSGERLYRRARGDVYTCGKIFIKQPFRIPAKDGCGCVLNIKWLGAEQSCPLGLWHAEGQSSGKKKCCGG